MPAKASIQKHIVYLDLFSGTGGFALGLKQAGFVFKKHYYSEIDKYASANYQHRFRNAQGLGDITSISGKEIERPDIISFGSPCQDISLAGKRAGLKGKRSGLFFEALRLIRTCRPRVFIFENVKGLFSSNGGKDFEAVLRAFADTGLYDLQWQLLNTAWFLPQNRERIYIVGHLRGTARTKVFPVGEGTTLPQTLRPKGQGNKDIASALTSNYSKGVHGRGETYVSVLHWKNSKEKWVNEQREKIPALKTQNDLTRQPLIVSDIAYRVPEATSKGYAIASEGDSINMSYPASKSKRGRVGKGRAHTLDTNINQYTVHNGKVRRLTPVECERLQGFPDNWTSQGMFEMEQKEISDTQRYIMLGNAVSVPVVKQIGKKLLKQDHSLGSTEMPYAIEPEIVLSGAAQISVPELNVSYSRQGKPFLGHIRNPSDVADFIRGTYNEGEIELQEHFVVLFLNDSLNIIGYYRHSKGMINATMVDVRIVLATALKCLATGLIIAHNHPTGNNTPSEADKKLTQKLKIAAAEMEIALHDHIIVTTDGHFSFADNGMGGMEPLRDKRGDFVSQVKSDLFAQKRHSKVTLERLAKEMGIADRNEVKELTELAIVEVARFIALKSNLSVEEKYGKIVELYHSQVNLSHRTSQSILLQQYSTPAPIGYLMGIFCGLDKLPYTDGYAFEPSAGNGLLTIAAMPELVCVNEVDDIRRRNLLSQGFFKVWNRDASQPFFDLKGRFRAVVTNPPFGMLDTKVDFNGYAIRPLEHVMALYALDTMSHEGKAAIIIGGHTTWDKKGRSSAGRNRIFLNYLYHHYYVSDIIQLNGRKLYSRQGTGFNTRLILINGRKLKPEGAAPVYDKERDSVIQSFEHLYQRVNEAMDNQPGPAVSRFNQTVKLYRHYLKLKEKYPERIVIMADPEGYLIFGRDALEITESTDRKLSREFLFEGRPVPVLLILQNEISVLSGQLSKRGIAHSIAQFSIRPPKKQESDMEQEAKKLADALRKKSLGTAGESDFRITEVSPIDGLFDEFYEEEEPENDDDLFVDHDELFQEFLLKKKEDPVPLYMFETPETFVAFNEDAENLARTCKLGIVKCSTDGVFRYTIAASSKSLMIFRVGLIEDAGHKLKLIENPRYHTKRLRDMQDRELDILLKTHFKNRNGELGMAYQPSSDACIVLDTQVPDSMAFETQEALSKIKEAVGGDSDNFVRDRLGYPTKAALCKALSAEQIDAVMMAIYNIEARGQGIVIGDQTGIGKGRVAAGIIRYACQQGLKPVFLTEKANLFSDIYRDLVAIGSGRLKPFIVNGKESKTDIKDEDGSVIFQALPANEQQEIFSRRAVPANFDFVVATYTQFNSPDKKPEKPAFLSAIAEDNIFIMDEAHNSSGSSNTGNYLQGVVGRTAGVVFLSATFAKRPDNMPIYAMKTAISDCNMSRDQLVESIERGGVALQEVLSSQLVAEGQMLRRERSFEGIEVNYVTLTDKAPEHQAIADNITGIIRDIIAFQKEYIDKVVEELDDIAVADGKQFTMREGTSQAGVDNTPYFSKVFNIINQMLFSIKADSVAERAIERLKEGKKPIIAFSSTMGSFLEEMEDENGLPVADSSTINPDFSEVLRRGLDGVMRYTERDIDGQPEYKRFEISELSPEAQTSYANIKHKIQQISTGITLSPIDVVIKKIRDAGYSVAEVTGRKYELQMNHNNSRALVVLRRRINTNDAFRQFNNNEVDVLMINQSGSTGASAHAIPTAKVPKEQVKQRVMIVLQAELDINTEVQKRGRINRTGQIMKPIYDYVSSAIPAEMRLMMMLQQKLKSLDANTASNQKQSNKILDVPDFLNKYGDRVVKEYLLENQSINRMLDDPLRLKNTTDSDRGDAETMENAAHKVSGRVAVLSVQMQQEFYSEITDRYNDYVSYLQQIGEYDLELEAMNLQAETINTKVVKMGNGSGSLFSEDSILETVKANVLKKPFTVTELENLLNESLQGSDPKMEQDRIISDYKEETGMSLEIEEKEINDKHNEMDRGIYLEKKFCKLKTEPEQEAYVKKREQEIEESRSKSLKVLRDKAIARSHYLEKLFRFYYIGRNLNFPIDNFNGYKEYVPTVFLGFVIDWKRKNPFLPSKIKLRFALANSSKYFAMPASFDDPEKIIGASADLPELSRDQLMQQWAKYIQENNTDRRVRHIITGNLLQAFSDFKGKLVNYTTIDGKVSKGILMPENWVVDEKVQDKVDIPVYKALPLIKSLVTGNSIITTTGIGFLRQPGQYKIIVPMSRKVAGDIYLDKDLLDLIDTNNFNKVSDKMVGLLDEKNIEKFVAIIQDKHNCSVTVTRHQFNSMEKQDGHRRNRKSIRLPGPEKLTLREDKTMEILSLEAEALKLKLRLKLRLAA